MTDEESGMTVFTDTNYRESGAGDLVEYLDKEDGLRNRLGEQMSPEEIQAFIEQSEEYGFERQIIISPQHGDQLSDRELSHYTRKVMSEFCTDRPTATYCYAIHRDTDHPHTQVAVTGTKRDLWMDTEDCEELREIATEQFHEQHNELTAELERTVEQTLADDLDLEIDIDRDLEADRDEAVTQEAAPEQSTADADQSLEGDADQAEAESARDAEPEAEPDTAREPDAGRDVEPEPGWEPDA